MENDALILSFIGKVVAYGGGGAAVAYTVFIFFGKKWLENKFAQKLQEYKHAQSKEIEELKFRINSLFSRVSRIHEKEIEILPEAWYKLNDTLSSLRRLVSLLQTYPDINSMSPDRLNEFISESELPGSQKKELLDSADKNKYYQDVIFFHELKAAKQVFFDFHYYIENNRVFLSSDLKEQFGKIDDLIWEALVNRETAKQTDDHKMWLKSFRIATNDIIPIKQTIEDLVQKRLHYPTDE